jgi:hypothetical protein
MLCSDLVHLILDIVRIILPKMLSVQKYLIKKNCKINDSCSYLKTNIYCHYALILHLLLDTLPKM